MFGEKIGPGEADQGIERERQPRYVINISRHAERLPSGELAPEGVESAQKFGQELGQTAEVVKGYASDHLSKRAYATAELASQASGVTSPVRAAAKAHKERLGSGFDQATGYVTREVSDIQYDILKPGGLAKRVATVTDKINEATLREAGLSTERDEQGKLRIAIDALPAGEQLRLAPIRQKYQEQGLSEVLKDPAVVERLAMGLGHQVVHQLELLKRYSGVRKAAEQPVEKDVVLNTTSHGMFGESLLMKAGIYRKSDGQEVPIDDWGDPELNLGPVIQPAESYYLQVDDPSNVPHRIPVLFRGADRPPQGTIFIDTAKLLALEETYQQWKTSQ